MQDFKNVTLNTEISEGLEILLKRDLCCATMSYSTYGFPEIPYENQTFDFGGDDTVYTYSLGQWNRLWNYSSGSPYTLNNLTASFQPKNSVLTSFSIVQHDQGRCFVYPNTSVKFQSLQINFLNCQNPKALSNLLGLGDISLLDTVGGKFIDDRSIPQSKFQTDLESIERDFKTGDTKYTFSKTFDPSRWVVYDESKSLGSPFSSADYRGTIYKPLFLKLGGTESEWSTGTVVYMDGSKKQLGQSESSGGNATTSWFYEETTPGNYQIVIPASGTYELILVGGSGQSLLRLTSYNATASSGGGGAYVKGFYDFSAGDVVTVSVGTSYNSVLLDDLSGERLSGNNGTDTSVSLLSEVIFSAHGGESGLIAPMGATVWREAGVGGDFYTVYAGSACTAENGNSGYAQFGTSVNVASSGSRYKEYGKSSSVWATAGAGHGSVSGTSAYFKISYIGG